MLLRSPFVPTIIKLTPAVHFVVMPSSMNEILVSLSRKGGLRDLPGDREGCLRHASCCTQSRFSGQRFDYQAGIFHARTAK